MTADTALAARLAGTRCFPCVDVDDIVRAKHCRREHCQRVKLNTAEIG